MMLKDTDSEKQRTWSMSIRRLRVIKPVIQLSIMLSYVDIGGFAREWQKNRIDVQVDISPPSTLRKSISTEFLFSEQAGLLIIRCRNYLSTVKLLSDGPNYTHFKMRNSIGYTTKLLGN
jgi:hypothetical protein